MYISIYLSIFTSAYYLILNKLEKTKTNTRQRPQEDENYKLAKHFGTYPLNRSANSQRDVY